MDAYTVLLYLSFFVCLFLLPRLPSPKATAGHNSGDVEDLVLTCVGHIPAHGPYVCLTRADGAMPNLDLQYTVTYTHGYPSRHTSCNGDLTRRDAELGLFCLPPCPRVEATHLLLPVTLVVTGHDRATGEVTAALVETLTLSVLADVAPTVVQAGRGVMEVGWTGRPGSSYRVQLWHHPRAIRDDPALDEGETEEETSASGGIDDKTFTKIRQCYHESDFNEDEDDDNDDDDDDDHEEDNDDFLKWKWWRHCVALHTPHTTVPHSVSPSAVVYTSEPLTYHTKTCLHYVTDAPFSGSLSVVLMEVTHSLLHAKHTTPTPLLEWTVLPVQEVIITSAYVESNLHFKTMTIILMYGQSERGPTIEGKIEPTTEAALKNEEENVEETESAWEDLQAMVINEHNRSETVNSQPGECGHLHPLGAGSVVCSVGALETLEDPEGRGPISSLLLLLTSHNTAASTLLAITDVHVRVRQVGPGAVLVLWDRDTTVREFAVTVAPEAGLVYDTVTVACDNRGSDCLVDFQGLAPGQYIAEVSYERKTRVMLRTPFIVEEYFL